MIQKIKLTDLAPNMGQIEGLPANPRIIKDGKFEKLKKSLQDDPEMLDLRELLVFRWEDKYVIIGGNMRYRAALDLGITELPCKIIPPDTPISKLKAYTLKDNIAYGEYDWDMLSNEWDGEDLLEWGLDVWADSSTNDGGGSREDADDLPNEEDGSIEVRCKIGDVWQLGDHRLMCGDSVNLDDVKKLMGGVMADMCFTDPPYGVSIGDKNKALNEVQRAERCTTNIENDTLSAEDLYPILVAAMTNVRLSCKDDACYFVTSPQGGELGMMMMMMKDAGLPVRHILIWEKSSATFSLGRLDYEYQHEPIFYTWTKKHHNYREGEYRTTIWKYDKPKKCDLHPTMKPVALVENCLRDATKEGDVVVDFFGGSGTTLIACENLNRKCRTMEKDPHYCDVIITRWETMTGREAVKIQGND